MDRFGLRDDQWERIKDFLPGREGHVGRIDFRRPHDRAFDARRALFEENFLAECAVLPRYRSEPSEPPHDTGTRIFPAQICPTGRTTKWPMPYLGRRIV